MADIKELQTRIALKYDSYTNWTKAPGKDLVLLPGEVGICEIQAANTASNVAPTVLFKVGGSKYPDGHTKAGQLMTFEDLPWASAKAADVYSWAKASDVVLEDKTIKFVGTDKTIAINYITPDEVKAITDPLAARIVAVENAVNGAEGTTGIKASIEALDGRLDTLEGTGAGSVAKAQADAQAYADGKAAAAQTAAETTAKNYTDAEVLKDRNRLDTLEAYKTAHETEYTELEGRVDAVEQGVTDAESRINEKLGDDFSADNTVADALLALDTALAGTQEQLGNLQKGQVAQNKQKSEENAASILAMDTAYKAADQGLSDRIGEVEETLEVFFADAAKDGEGLTNALDTLKEIQTFINTDGTTAAKMASDIKANTDDIAEHNAAIEALQSIVNLDSGSGGLKDTLENMQSEIDRNENNITTLQNITSGYTGAGSIKAAIEQAQQDATNAGDAAEQAQADATDAKNRVGVIEGKVNNATSGLAATYKIASDNASDISDLKDLTQDYSTVVQNVTDLKAVVETGDNSNAKLRQDIGTIQSIVNGTNGNSALAGRIKIVEDAINHADTGLKALNTAVSSHDGRIAKIESDYLKAADQIIFQCGTSSTNTFTA